MKFLRLSISLTFLLAVLTLGFVPGTKAEEDFGAKCNCYIPNQQKYGVSPDPYTSCTVDPNCFILLP